MMEQQHIDKLAAHYVATRSGIGMVPPFYAETAHTRGDETWPLWIVRNKSCNSLGMMMPRDNAEALAAAMNKAAEQLTSTQRPEGKSC